MDYDIVIAGAGPAGLCLARTLSGHGLRIAVVEQQKQEALEKPAFDGREIALTHASRRILEGLGLWQAFDPDDISDLRDARISDGDSAHALQISARDGRSEKLGWLVPNHVIRRAAWQAVSTQDNVELVAGCGVQAVARGAMASP